MTIGRYNIKDYERCSRLAFGVPLEDAFPDGELHPYLEDLFYFARKKILSCGHSVEKIISDFQGTLSERLCVKENVVLCQPMSGFISPGALLWVIRHFIGLLPLPLLPSFTDGASFNWTGLSRFCKNSLLKIANAERNNKNLTKTIAEELLRLPPPNLLLFGTLLNFIRELSASQGRSTRIHKYVAFCLVRYFSSSIFVRPFRPGQSTKIDRQYFPLLLYLILKWPEIEAKFKQIGKPQYGSCYDCIAKSYDFPVQPHHRFRQCLRPTTYSSTTINFAQPLHTFRHASVQTDDFTFRLETISEKSLECLDFLRDTGCQTEITMPIRKRAEKGVCCCNYGSHYESNLNGYVQRFLLENKCSQTGSSIAIDRSLSDLQLPLAEMIGKTEVGINTDSQVYYGWIDPRFTVRKSNSTFSPKSFVSNSDYFYDEYLNSNMNLLGEDNITQPSSVTTPVKQPTAPDSSLMARISKIGWTYTPPKVASDESSSTKSPTTVSKTALKEENYMLYFNEKELASQEKKEKCSPDVKSPKEEVFEDNENMSLASSVKSKKSFSVTKLKSKLDFLKVFSVRKSKLQNSSSLEEVRSNIKYKKMNSVKSTIF